MDRFLDFARNDDWLLGMTVAAQELTRNRRQL
jgi:hypothetical protein